MNHLSIIQKEFLKEARKWDDLSLEEQKGYLKRHPRTKRRITAKPESGKKTKDTSKETGDDSNEGSSDVSTYKDFADKINNKHGKGANAWAKSQIIKLEEKMESNIQRGIRREQRARGDLDGTAIEAAHDRNEPMKLQVNLLKHFISHGNKKLPTELQEQFDRLNEHKKYKTERKEEHKKEKEKYADLMGKVVSWTSRKNHGQEMSGTVVAVKSGRRGVKVTLDNGWRVPVSMLNKKDIKEPPKSQKNKELVKPAELVGKKITWKTKYNPSTSSRWHSRGGFRYRSEKQPPPGYDSSTGTASGVVESTKGSKLVVGGWRIPITIIQKVDDKKFDRWK